MSLQPLQRKLIEDHLGVQPKRKGLHIANKTEKTDKKITGALDDYTRREEKVLEAVKDLASIPATGQMATELEMKVTTVRRTIENLGRDAAPATINQAYKDLEDIKDEARAAAKLAKANQDFYSLLEVADRSLKQFEDHAHHAFIEDDTPAIEQTLQKARNAAKAGDFKTAEKELESAGSASRSVAEKLNRFDSDLIVFNKAAKASEDGLTYLDGHPNKQAGAGDIGTATGRLAAARQDAVDCDLPAARQKLAEAEQARLKAKTAADTGFITLIDAAKVDLDAVLTGADPAVVKAMTAAVGLIDTKLTSARAQVATDIVKADQLLDEATQETTLAIANRDQAATDINKLRADARPTEAALKALDAHPQKAHASAEIQTAIARLASAKSETEEGRIAEARLFQTQADTSAAAAKEFADKYAAFLVKYGEQIRFCNGLKKTFSGWTDVDNPMIALETAKTKANTQRKYTEAEGDLTNATQALRGRKDELKPIVANMWDARITDLTSKLTTIKPGQYAKADGIDASALDNTNPATTGVDGNPRTDADADPGLTAIHGDALRQINAMKASIEQDIEAANWGNVAFKRELMHGMVTAAEKLAKRRETYNTDRDLTLTAIQGLKGYKSLLGHMMSLQNLVVRADKLATSKDMRFEDACKELKSVRDTCTMLVDIGKAADTYIQERAAADAALEELEKVA